MHGDELEWILQGYVSDLENAAMRHMDGAIASSASGIEVVNQWLIDSVPGAMEHGSPGRALEATATVSDKLQPVAEIESLLFTGRTPTMGRFDTPNLVDAVSSGEGSRGQLISLRGAEAGSLGLSALVNLLRGPDQDERRETTEANQYVWPIPSHATEGVTGTSSGTSAIDVRYDGLPRQSIPAEVNGSRIDIRIEALDARSILDRKEDIAEAVRQAMLTSGLLGVSLSEY